MSLVEPGGARRAGEVGLGDDRDLGLRVEEASPERAGRHEDDARLGRAGAVGQPSRDAVSREHLVDPPGEPRALGDGSDGPAVPDPGAQLGDRPVGVTAIALGLVQAQVERHPRVLVAAVGGERREGPPRHTGITGLGAQVGDAAIGPSPEDRAQVDGSRATRGDRARGGRVGPARFEELLARGDQVVGAQPDPFGVVGDDHRPRGEHVEQGLHSVDEDGQQRLHPLDGDALGDLLQQVGDAGQLRDQVAGALADRVGEQQFAARRRPQPPVGHLKAALVGDPEPPDLLDGVAPELHSQRVFLGRREDVEDPPADRELTSAFDQVGPAVCRRHQVLDDLFERAVLARAQSDRDEIAQAGRDRLEHCADGGDNDVQRGGRRVRRSGVVGGARTLGVFGVGHTLGGVGVGQPTQDRQATTDSVTAG
jgi:hypothetical protein